MKPRGGLPRSWEKEKQGEGKNPLIGLTNPATLDRENPGGSIDKAELSVRMGRKVVGLAKTERGKPLFKASDSGRVDI